MKISKIAAKSLRLKSQQYGINYEKLQSIYEKGLNEYFVNSPENTSWIVGYCGTGLLTVAVLGLYINL